MAATALFLPGSSIDAPLPEGHVSNTILPSPQSSQSHDGPQGDVFGDIPDPQFIKPSAFTQSSSFRNVSACHRCRMRKHRCDQQLPKCRSCEKAQVRCVGYDPITKQEIPRSYVYFLENRVDYLKEILLKHNINFQSAIPLNDDGANCNTAATSISTSSAKVEAVASSGKISDEIPLDTEIPELSNSFHSVILDLLSGKDTKLEITRINEVDRRAGNQQTSAQPSLFRFGFQSSVKGSMELPERETAEKLVDEYFIHTNLHVPVLNRPDFEKVFDQIYYSESSDHPKDQLYFVFIVFAIGAASVTRSHEATPGPELHFRTRSRKRKRPSMQILAAEEYHASAITCLGHCLDSCGNFNLFGDFEGLQALILLCSFALFKSTAPGLANLLDIAIRSAIDLRLYNEQDSPSNMLNLASKSPFDEAHRDWIKDLRRRLWWCVYSLDRLVAPYLERPFFIPDDVITTQFPSILDDQFITRRGILASVDNKSGYKYATLRSLDYSTLAAVSVLDKLEDKCHFAKRSMATLKSMATLTMQMKLSTAEFATPPSCFTHPSVSKETLPSLPTNTRMPDLRQFQGQISHDADPAGNASLQDSFQFPRSEFPPIRCEDETSKFKLAEDSLSKIPTITRDPEDNIKYKSMDFKPSEEACVFQGQYRPQKASSHGITPTLKRQSTFQMLGVILVSL
ncbi:positive regulator of purine utilization [Penicillium cosmopolitanum]|uniref:Positive regulator of purine utilization n=1 Tax=Penicillium cosmopolitanum TaxID=1131564 RepID=A0A9W9VT82_9EURO|nr:positive regulator of purine utilization [Penicillium cosmopolitanum]KAJ5388907.1 positive regulator of purine utilization [Penicillium cosmopolitanum]